jgi:hypothetical protein
MVSISDKGISLPLELANPPEDNGCGEPGLHPNLNEND